MTRIECAERKDFIGSAQPVETRKTFAINDSVRRSVMRGGPCQLAIEQGRHEFSCYREQLTALTVIAILRDEVVAEKATVPFHQPPSRARTPRFNQFGSFKAGAHAGHAI